MKNYATQFCSKAVHLLLGLLVFFGANTAFAQTQRQTNPAQEQRVKETLKKNAQKLRFIENKGQYGNKDVLYYFEGLDGSVYIQADQIRFVANEVEMVNRTKSQKMHTANPEPRKEQTIKGMHSFTVKMQGANSKPDIRLGDSFGTTYNFFMSEDPKDWVSGVRAAKDLTLHNIYPNIDLRLYSNSDGSLEFDWILYPGADFKKVQLGFVGQDGLAIDQGGNLEVALRFTKVKFHIPESYQVTDEGKVQVDFAFHKTGDKTIGFATDSKLDPRYPIIIDPILSWGTYFDGNDSGFDQYLFAIGVDPVTKAVYCTGATNRQISTATAPYDANGYLNTVGGLTGSSLPRVAVVYRLRSDGADLEEMTLYGPSSISGNNDVTPFALSLSDNRVFIGGHTSVDIPTTGSPFDGTRSSGDGFVAVFSKDLGTLHYATYLGSSSDEERGVTSIRALSDNSFVVGLTAEGALPAGPAAPDYITTGADLTYGGNGEMYIAKFSSNNSLDWGTYVGGSDIEVFSDLEIFPDGRVAFAGFGEGTLTEVNSAAGRSTGSSDYDGIIGVLSSDGLTFNYLDEIGGSNEDYIFDVTIIGSTLYFTGQAESGFPVTGGTYDTSHNSGDDVIVGTVSAAGSSGYIATYYGSSDDDIGNGIQQVTTTDCDGVTTSFLLVFGTTRGNNLPTANTNNEPFFQNSNQGGRDIFFAGFTSNLQTLTFATYIGGSGSDYLGDTGDSRGANHLCIEGADLYLGTTTHSSGILPTSISGGFDTSKSNGTDDSHIIMCLSFASLVDSDYGDAPATYGTPSHTLNCTNLKIGNLLDDEMNPLPNAAATGDDNDNVDDEDGLASVPTLTTGGLQNITITVNNILNTTGSTATLYGWIDLDSDGKFESGELATTTVANGFSGNKVLTWTGVTVSGSLTNHYIRLRLTTDLLTDNGATAAVDERSTSTASDGEVEDYLAIGAPQPMLTKSFSPTTFPDGGMTTLEFTISNTASGAIAQSGLAFTDNLPSSLRVASPPNITGSCGGTVTAVAGSTTISLTGGSVAASGTCTFSVKVTNVPGQLNASCGANPAAFTNSSTNISGLAFNLGNSVQPSCVTVTPSCAISATATPTAALCNGASSGKITMTLSGGIGLYDIAWDGPGANDGTANNQSTGYMITNLPAGNYAITVTDDNSCTKTTSATVTEPSAVSASATPTAALCFGASTGKITMTISGGTGLYDITWDGPGLNDGTAFNQNSGYMIANLPAGNYAITVTDDNSCAKTTSATVNQPTEMSVAATPTAALCNGGNGKITMTLSGGTGLYDIAWNGPGANDGTANNQSNGYMIANLPAGVYNITVTDDNSCAKTTSATVTEPTVITTTATPTAALCNGASSGKITMSLSGGTGVYDIAWDGPGANDGTANNQNNGYMIANLPAGVYNITVTDDNSCAKTTSATVNQPTAVSATATPTAALCNGASTGKITMTLSGGTGVYDIAWDGPGANDGTANNQNNGYMIANLPAGVYNITVTDDNSCAKTTSATVNQPAAVSATATPTDALCNGENGKITMSLSGGTGLYDIAWDGPGANDGIANNQSNGYMIANLPAGVYNITVTDDNSCMKTTSATVNQPAALTASAAPTDASCTGDSNGKITLTIGGGTTPYDITWNGPGANDGTANNQASGYMISNLPEGVYAITVTDDKGCTKTTSATISANPLPVCSISDAMGVVCPNSAGNQYSAPAGMDVYAWTISGNGSIPGSKTGSSVDVTAGASGSYTLSVTITKNGCTSTCSKPVNISMIPFSIVFTPQYCADDPGPVIGLNGSEVGAMYQLQTGAGANIGAPKAGTGSAISFGTYPNGNYKVVITGGTCNGTLTANVQAAVGGCNISVPEFCVCNHPSGYAPITIKVTAPAGQNWTVKDVTGLYGAISPYPWVQVGMPLTYIGNNMYTLDVARANTNGFFVQVTNGFTDFDISVGTGSW